MERIQRICEEISWQHQGPSIQRNCKKHVGQV
jgi:hypothetical protein